ncbi:MAG: aminotransferase class I/II-fold pyridoxal phosphate-dependent enzyme [Flavobacteriaceae bacterium]|nr:aminotransferase class I/II-fold pyridoxal phosphate-dependent enzyme [Flavobacteriaceae bacterium]
MTARRLDRVQEYYFSKKLREVRAMIASGKPVINMGIGSPDLPPPQEVVDALHNSMLHPTAHKYQSYQGIPALREAIADFYQNQYGVTLNPENEILPMLGSKEGIMHISMAFLNPGDQVLVPNPGYPTYTSVTRLVEAETVFYNLEADHHWQPNLEKLKRIDCTKVRLMWINSPHMPTGTTIDPQLLTELVGWAKENDILLVNDNPYSFVLTDQPQSIFQNIDDKSHVMELNSLSKSFNMAGWRMGMLSGSKENINHVLKVKSNMDSGMFYGIQQGAIAALQQPQSWFDHINAIYRERREQVWKLAEAMGCTFSRDNSGMFVWAKLPDGYNDSEHFIDQLLHEKHIFLAPGTIFGSAGQGYIRFSLCIDKNQIEVALNRLEK